MLNGKERVRIGVYFALAEIWTRMHHQLCLISSWANRNRPKVCAATTSHQKAHQLSCFEESVDESLPTRLISRAPGGWFASWAAVQSQPVQRLLTNQKARRFAPGCGSPKRVMNGTSHCKSVWTTQSKAAYAEDLMLLQGSEHAKWATRLGFRSTQRSIPCTEIRTGRIQNLMASCMMMNPGSPTICLSIY